MNGSIEYYLHEEEDAIYLCLAGDLDQKSFMTVTNALAGHPLDRPVKVDLERVGYADSTGLRSLVLLQRQAREAGAEFTLLALSDSIKRIFRSTGLAQVFRIEPEDTRTPCHEEECHTSEGPDFSSSSSPDGTGSGAG